VGEHKSKAIILASGPGDARQRDQILSLIEESLKPFTLTILDSQSIAISNRVIIGVEIELDPAHAAAIESDIQEVLKEKNFDVALELL
jgi:hypothetical protein